MQTTVLTLAMDDEAQTRFERVRRMHFPPALNRVPAHLSLFHTLALDEPTKAVLAAAARGQQALSMRVSGVMSLGRGVAYAIESGALTALHGKLAASFCDQLTAQDRQRLRPHVVVQNKVSVEEAKQLRAQLEADFAPWEIVAEGLLWWEYLGGPWRLLERFAFAPVSNRDVGPTARE